MKITMPKECKHSLWHVGILAVVLHFALDFVIVAWLIILSCAKGA